MKYTEQDLLELLNECGLVLGEISNTCDEGCDCSACVTFKACCELFNSIPDWVPRDSGQYVLNIPKRYENPR